MGTELLIGLIGVGGTLAGTLVGVLSNYYLSERRETRKRTIEDWDKVVEEVYSPLIFELESINDYGTLQNLRVMSKQIPILLEKHSKEQVVTLMPGLLAFVKNDKNQMIEGILRKNVRLIKPNALWSDLVYFWDALKLVEKNLGWVAMSIDAGKLSKQLSEFDLFIAKFQSYARFSGKLSEGATYLIKELTRMAQTEKLPKSLCYKPFFTEDVRREMVKELESTPMFPGV
jgi:hypothetical protein